MDTDSRSLCEIIYTFIVIYVITWTINKTIDPRVTLDEGCIGYIPVW